MHKDDLKEPYGLEMYVLAASQQTPGTEGIGLTRAQATAGSLTTSL